MLNHEWTRQRDRHIRQASREARPEEAETLLEDGYSPEELAALEEAEAQAERQAAEALELAAALEEAPAEAEGDEPEEIVAEVAVESAPEPAAETQSTADEPGSGAAPALEVAPEPLVAEVAGPAEEAPAAEGKAPEEVAAGLEVPLSGLRERLQAVLARQAQLPLDIEARRDVSEQVDGSPRETREMLVRRLLDPTLTLEETAVLLGVCPTTVRRYTNRGVLACYRTPGNQRRFHLTDILDFMERQGATRS